jgi:hypothetical protein
VINTKIQYPFRVAIDGGRPEPAWAESAEELRARCEAAGRTAGPIEIAPELGAFRLDVELAADETPTGVEHPDEEERAPLPVVGRANPSALAGYVVQDALGISRRDGETVREALARAGGLRPAAAARLLRVCARRLRHEDPLDPSVAMHLRAVLDEVKRASRGEALRGEVSVTVTDWEGDDEPAEIAPVCCDTGGTPVEAPPRSSDPEPGHLRAAAAWWTLRMGPDVADDDWRREFAALAMERLAAGESVLITTAYSTGVDGALPGEFLREVCRRVGATDADDPRCWFPAEMRISASGQVDAREEDGPWRSVIWKDSEPRAPTTVRTYGNGVPERCEGESTDRHRRDD